MYLLYEPLGFKEVTSKSLTLQTRLDLFLGSLILGGDGCVTSYFRKKFFKTLQYRGFGCGAGS